MGGKQFAGATQLLSASAAGDDEAQGQAAADSMAEAVGQTRPDGGSGGLEVSKEKFKWKEFRTPTKQLLSGVANSLQQSLPEGFSLQSAKPCTVLRPCGPLGSRCLYTNKEKEVHGFSEAGRVYFTYDHDTRERCPDFMASDDFYHLTCSADEGTEATGWCKHSLVVEVIRSHEFSVAYVCRGCR